MDRTVLTEIENRFITLTQDEQLWLLERLVRRLRRRNARAKRQAWENELPQMAADPEIQTELRKIEAEFRGTVAPQATVERGL